jgi:hypothetical protein
VKIKWETIEQECATTIYRTRVPWGWLVYAVDDVFHSTSERTGSGWDWRSSVAFVFDPFHWWRVT